MFRFIENPQLFKNLTVWRKFIDLFVKIYEVTKRFNKNQKSVL